MKRHRKIIYSLVATVTIASASATYSLNQQSANFDQQANQISSQNVSVSHQSKCDPNLWNYVYHPQRLPTKNDCRTVSGTVMWVKHEPDGDYHIRLQENGASNDPLNDVASIAPINDKNIGGFLVVEPICQTTGMSQPTQADAIQGCAQYVKDNQPQFLMPKVGDHITVTGFYTIDNQHKWMEIHNAIIK